MPSQSCVFTPAVPEGWHKSEQRSAGEPALLQAVPNFASTGGTWGEAFLPRTWTPAHGPGAQEGFQTVPASSGHTLLFCKPEGLQLSLSLPPLQKDTVSARGFWDWILRDTQS